MAIEPSSKHLIQAIYQVKGWNLYKRTVDKSGKVISKVYKNQVREGNKVITTTKRLSGANTRLTQTITKATSKQNDLVRALKRAAVVAPIWLALRAVMMSVLTTIREGAKYWIEFDKAIQKSRQVIHGATGTIGEAIISLKDNIKDLSIETGVSMAKLSSTFYRFGTVGLNVQKSMEGMEVSTKLATVMFGNSDEIARVLAQAYRLLGDSIDQTIPSQKRLAVTGAQIRKLWEDNAFEINEFTGAMQQFLPVANVFNFSMTETIALLSTLQTAGLKATKAGRLLRTGVSKLVSNLDQVALTLGVHVNPALDSTFDVLMRVLKAIKTLSDAGGELPIEALEAMTIFGGVRSRQAGLALVALYDTLNQNLQNINTEHGKYNALLDEQNEKYKKVLKSVHKQAERFKNLRGLIGQAFVKGVAGADTFADSLERINTNLEKSINTVQLVTGVIRETFLTLVTGQLYSTRKSIADMKKYMEDIKNLSDVKGLGQQTIYPELGRYMGAQEVPENKKSEEVRRKISRSTEHQLALLTQELKYVELQNKGYDKSAIAQEKLNTFLREKVRLYNTTGRVIMEQVEALNEQEVISLALAGNYEELLNLSKGTAISEKDILKIEKMRQAIDKAAIPIAQKRLQMLIQHETNLLKTKGATKRQVLETTIEMEKQLGMNQSTLSLLKNQLDLEVAIKKEKEAQTKLSSNTMKIYEIAQKEGLTAAKQISEFLQGRMTYQTLQTREIFGTFQKYFPQIEKTMQALKYFKRGEGRGVRIEEEAIREPRAVTGLKARRTAERAKAIPQVPIVPPKVDINTTIQQIEVKLPEGSLDRMAEETGKQVTNKLLMDEKLRKSLAKALRPYL